MVFDFFFDFFIPMIIGAVIAILMAIQAYWPLRPIRNDDLEKAIAETSKLIGKANGELKIVSGTLYPRFYSDERILQALLERVNHGVEVKILYGPKANPSDVPKLKELAEQGKIEMCKWYIEPPCHFMVCDHGKHLRLEGFHPEEITEKGISARLIYNSVKLGWEYDKLFDKLWSLSQQK
jgi:hypothetical protein